MSQKEEEILPTTDEVSEETPCCEVCEEEVISETIEVDEVAVLQQKIAELEDKFLRANADFDNMRRRMDKEKYQAIAYAHEVFARDLLPVIDSLEMAILSGSNTEVESTTLLEKVKEGLNLTVQQFRKALEKRGSELVDSNTEFDPTIHDAVMQLESEEKNKGEILQELQKGYKIKERILRPAMVSIVK